MNIFNASTNKQSLFIHPEIDQRDDLMAIIKRLMRTGLYAVIIPKVRTFFFIFGYGVCRSEKKRTSESQLIGKASSENALTPTKATHGK